MSPIGRQAQPILRTWAVWTALGAVVVSIADALLLHRQRGIFEGGFLSPEHLDTWGERLGFTVLSLLADAAVVGLLMAVAFRLAAWMTLRHRAAILLALSVGVLPLIVADVIAYELVAKLGDAFDLSLMFDLTGRSLHEVLAVSSEHLLVPTLMLLATIGVTAAAVAAVHRRSGGDRLRHAVRWMIPIGIFLAAFVVQTAVRANDEILDDALRRKPSGKVFAWVADGLTDLDRDGYGILRQPRDPAWFDGDVYPYAIDTPGNGVDENGIGGDLPADGPTYSEPGPTAPAFARRPDVVLVVLESVRGDVVGAALDDQPVTPVMNRIAAAGISSTRAYSHNGYTTRSRRHLFTGSLAGLRGEATLIDDFRANGYDTAYFSGQNESFGGEALSIHPERADVFYDARQDIDKRYSTFTSPGSLAVPFDLVVQRVDEYLTRRAPEKPLFLHVNFHDTHFPYWHDQVKPLIGTTILPQADIVPEHADALRRMYLNTVANIDAAIGRVIARVEATTGRTPAVIVTSDHGESLYDAGFLGHGYALNDAQTRVPLVASGLPLDIVEPFGQSSLREVIWNALCAETQNGQPAIRQDAGRRVFQYLGSFERPRQIALTGLDTQHAYDFRSDRFQIAPDVWKRRRDLNAGEHAAFLALIHHWERMRLAAAALEGPRQ